MTNNITSLNTIAAAAADISVVAGKVNIDGSVAGENFSEAVPYAGITSSMVNGGIKGFLIEDLKVVSVAFTAAASTTYAFTVSQLLNGQVKSEIISYTSDATGAAATIAANLVNTFNKYGFQITATGTGTPITLTALTGYATFDVVAISNVTPTTTPAVTFTTPLQAGSISNAEPRVVTATAHGLTNGMTVSITGVTGAGAADVNGTHRITRTGANTFTLDGTSATGTVTVTSAVGVSVAQNKFGYGAQLVTDGVFNASALTLYSKLELVYANPVTPLNTISQNQAGNSQTMWVSAATVATPNTPTTNYADFVTRMIEVSHAFVAAGTTADPDIIAKN